MKVYEAWKKTLEMLGGEREEALFWGDYYAQETQNYKKILGEEKFRFKGHGSGISRSVQYGAGYVCGLYRRSQYQP